MQTLKRFFVMPYLLACLLATAHSLWQLAAADEQGAIFFTDLTGNYRLRPEPETFLAILDTGAHRV